MARSPRQGLPYNSNRDATDSPSGTAGQPRARCLTSRTTSQRIAEEGYTILPDAIEPEFVDEIDEALAEVGARTGHRAGRQPLRRAAHHRGCTTCSSTGLTFQKIPLHPNVLPVVEGVLDPGLLISSLSSIAIGPDETGAADPRRRSAHPPGPSPRADHLQHHVGHHRLHRGERSDTACPGQPSPRRAAKSPRALRDRSRPRCPRAASSSGSGASGTAAAPTAPTQRRVGIAMNYCAGYIRQQENQQLGLPPALVKTFPRRLQELVGYSVYNGLVGHIDKKHPAKVVLAENEGVDMVWDLLKSLIDLRPPAQAPRAPPATRSRVGRWGPSPAADATRRSACAHCPVPVDLRLVQPGRGRKRAAPRSAPPARRAPRWRPTASAHASCASVDLDAVVVAEVDQGPPALAIGIEMAVDHPGVEHRPAPAPLDRGRGPKASRACVSRIVRS